MIAELLRAVVPSLGQLEKRQSQGVLDDFWYTPAWMHGRGGKVQSPEDALGLSAWWNAIAIIAGTMGSLPLKLYRKEGERRIAGKLTTRKDVLTIIELYNRDKILPLAVRLDRAEAALRYLTAPWWRRMWWELKRMGDNLLGWLERTGVKLYTWDTGSEDISPHAGGETDEADSQDRGGA